MMHKGFDIESACELVAECEKSELRKNEPDEDPTRSDQIAVLKIDLDSGESLYVKMKMPLPGLETGQFLSFKEWT